MGKSISTIRINGSNAATVNIIDDSSVKVVARNRSFIIVHVFDNTQVEAERHDTARIVVITHSHNAKVIAKKDVTFKEEYDYLK